MAKIYVALSFMVIISACFWNEISSTVTEVTSQAELTSKLQEAGATKSVIITFTSSQCSNCKTMDDDFAGMAVGHPEVVFLKVDKEKHPELANAYNIKTIPNFVYLKNGNQKVDAPVTEVTSKLQLNEKLSGAGSQKTVVVAFSSLVCKPCVGMEVLFKILASDYPHVTFLKVDSEVYHDIAKAYDVKSIPYFIFFKNGQKVDTVDGAEEDQLEDKIKNIPN